MTDALFSALELPTASHQRTGYRLQRIEVYNWGTFDRTVWTINPTGDTSPTHDLHASPKLHAHRAPQGRES